MSTVLGQTPRLKNLLQDWPITEVIAELEAVDSNDTGDESADYVDHWLLTSLIVVANPCADLQTTRAQVLDANIADSTAAAVMLMTAVATA
jgi:hypothetical protein